jgi:hypothetical protein
VFVCAGSRRGSQRNSFFRWRFDRACEQVGLSGISPKTLRRKAVSLAIERGAPMPVVQTLPGNRKSRTTPRAVHVGAQISLRCRSCSGLGGTRSRRQFGQRESARQDGRAQHPIAECLARHRRRGGRLRPRVPVRLGPRPDKWEVGPATPEGCGSSTELVDRSSLGRRARSPR